MTNDVPAPTTPDMDAPGASGRMERWISALLRLGVGLSLVLIFAGTAMSFVHHPDYLTSVNALERLTRPGAAWPHSPAEVVAGLHARQGRAVVSAGLLLLIITPVMRVAVSLLVFILRRDRVYMLITLGVLGLLLAAYAVGGLE